MLQPLSIVFTVLAQNISVSVSLCSPDLTRYTFAEFTVVLEAFAHLSGAPTYE